MERLPKVWNFKFRSPYWMMPIYQQEPPVGFEPNFEGTLKIPEHIYDRIDFQFMIDWTTRIKRYAEFEFQALMDDRRRKKK